MSKELLAVTQINGSPRNCGRAYGEAFAIPMMGFCKQELRPDKRRLAYARACWKHTLKHAPTSAQFVQGMAEGSHLSLDHAALLTLHEEVYHEPHCTAFAATRTATVDGKTIVAQNWDWGSNLYPWAGLLKLAMHGFPTAALYHYPGLWASAGINEHGLTLMWTGGGYLPKVAPLVGVPTYILIAEVLLRKNVAQAITFLSSVPIAGCFLFHLGDASGNIAVVEGAAGKQHIDVTGDLLFRANHYTCRDIVACSKQSDPLPKKGGVTTVFRYRRMKQLMKQHAGRITPATAKSVLTDRHGKWPWIHAYPGGPEKEKLAGLTIDSLFSVCQDRTLITCRGGLKPGPWQTISL